VIKLHISIEEKKLHLFFRKGLTSEDSSHIIQSRGEDTSPLRKKEVKMSIKEKRQAKHLTQEELAKIMGVDRSTVTKWENGQANPKIAMLPTLAIQLGCTVDELLREGGETDGRAEGEAGVQVS
jgi:DNA-binding XRE family transcriptional regulator